MTVTASPGSELSAQPNLRDANRVTDLNHDAGKLFSPATPGAALDEAQKILSHRLNWCLNPVVRMVLSDQSVDIDSPSESGARIDQIPSCSCRARAAHFPRRVCRRHNPDITCG
jgi:hypothetical protein